MAIHSSTQLSDNIAVVSAADGGSGAMRRPTPAENGDSDKPTAPNVADLYIASDGPYDDVYFYFYPYGLLY